MENSWMITSDALNFRSKHSISKFRASDVISTTFSKFLKTSLKIFKHYKLKPSFSIIKDEEEKDKATPSFNNLIKFDPI